MPAGPLARIGDWPAAQVAAAVVADSPTGLATVAAHGPVDRPFPLASVTKLATALAVLVAVEEGTADLDAPAATGPPGSTLRHLLAHASGLGPDGGVLAPPGRRRIYSNAGFEAAAALVGGASGLPFARYLAEAVFDPLGMASTSLDGSPASGATSTVDDLARLAAELLAPTLIAPATLAEATTVQFPGLVGVLPGFGRQDPCDWGLGFERRDAKHPHWTGSANSPGTFGHFGRSGTFLWVDPEARVALACLTDRDFGPWAATAWPDLADTVLDWWATNGPVPIGTG
jgi:CubicO group peptidase (beta-lactamase class C family)